MSRFKSTVQIVSVVVMLAAWLMASNRCALAAMVGQTMAAKVAGIHQCCPEKTSGGGEEKPAQRTGECCQRLNVTLADASAKLATAPVDVEMFALAWVCFETLQREVRGGKMPQTNGPPGAPSFAEVVLQRSLLSHAPPVVG